MFLLWTLCSNGENRLVVGIGIDLVEPDRMRRALERSGERLLRRLFTPAERAYCDSHADPIPHLSARFAAKEALFKALGTGWSGGVSWTEAEVRVDARGRPELVLAGKTAEIARERGAQRVLVSLTHIDTAAGAIVVLEGAERA
jgi:holo-[acyl-carrier protein] synthase